MNFDPFEWLPDYLKDAHPYVPGDQPEGEGWCKLNTNELPFPPSPLVKAAIEAELDRLPLYPNPTSQPLREAIAEHLEVDPAMIIAGNGSDDILNLLARAFAPRPGRVVQTEPSYSLYPVITTLANGEIRGVPFDESMNLPVDRLIQSQPDLLFLTHPNAPTGVLFPIDELKRLADGVKGILVLDEAYIEFSGHDREILSFDHPNVVHTRTFSKAYGLAGLRVGFGIADPRIIAILDRVRDSYNVNRLSQAGAVAALKDLPYYASCREKVIAEREKAAAGFEDWGWYFYPSKSNFLFVRPENGGLSGAATAQSLFEHLKKDKILIRVFPQGALTAPFVRISVGSKNQMNRLFTSLSAWKNATQP